MPFTSETGFSAYQRNATLLRNAYWRALGYPNLVLARAARWKGHVKKADRARELADPWLVDGKRPRGF